MVFAAQNRTESLVKTAVAKTILTFEQAEQLERRHQLYYKLLLPQAKQQTQASLLAYQSDRGDFSEVIQDYINDLNANLDELQLNSYTRLFQFYLEAFHIKT